MPTAVSSEVASAPPQSVPSKSEGKAALAVTGRELVVANSTAVIPVDNKELVTPLGAKKLDSIMEKNTSSEILSNLAQGIPPDSELTALPEAAIQGEVTDVTGSASEESDINIIAQAPELSQQSSDVVPANTAQVNRETLIQQYVDAAGRKAQELQQIASPDSQQTQASTENPTEVTPLVAESPRTMEDAIKEAQRKIAEDSDKFPKAKELKEALKDESSLFQRLLRRRVYNHLYDPNTGERRGDMTKLEIDYITNEALTEYNVIQQARAVAETQELADQITEALQREENAIDQNLQDKVDANNVNARDNLNEVTKKILDMLAEQDPREKERKRLSIWEILAGIGIVFVGEGKELALVVKNGDN